jgi:hypothetical protein
MRHPTLAALIADAEAAARKLELERDPRALADFDDATYARLDVVTMQLFRAMDPQDRTDWRHFCDLLCDVIRKEFRRASRVVLTEATDS